MACSTILKGWCSRQESPCVLRCHTNELVPKWSPCTWRPVTRGLPKYAMHPTPRLNSSANIRYPFSHHPTWITSGRSPKLPSTHLPNEVNRYRRRLAPRRFVCGNSTNSSPRPFPSSMQPDWRTRSPVWPELRVRARRYGRSWSGWVNCPGSCASRVVLRRVWMNPLPGAKPRPPRLALSWGRTIPPPSS